MKLMKLLIKEPIAEFGYKSAFTANEFELYLDKTAQLVEVTELKSNKIAITPLSNVKEMIPEPVVAKSKK